MRLVNSGSHFAISGLVGSASFASRIDGTAIPPLFVYCPAPPTSVTDSAGNVTSCERRRKPNGWPGDVRRENRTFTDHDKSVTLLVCPLLEVIVDRTLMATRSVTAEDKTAAGIDRASASRVLRYQLNVLAASAQDVVQSAGGWVFDRARAGWDVNVVLA